MNTKILLILLLLLTSATCAKDEGLPTQTLDSGAPMPVTPAGDLLDALTASPNRQGERPQTTRPIPHQQRNQIAPVPLQEELKANISKLPGVTLRSTGSSLSGSEGWFLDESAAKTGGPRALNAALEFGHSHTPTEGSTHMFLLPAYAQILLDKGRGELHASTNQIAGADSRYMMVYGPRDNEELAVVWLAVQASYAFATGQIE